MRKHTRPRRTHRMRELQNISGSVADAIARQSSDLPLTAVSQVLDLAPEQLLLYHVGTSESPGIAARFKKSEERRISQMLRRPHDAPFRFRNEHEFRWWVLSTGRLWLASGAEQFEAAGAEDHWFRGYALPSFEDYMGEIARFLAERSEKRQKTREWAAGSPGVRLPRAVPEHSWRRVLNALSIATSGRGRSPSTYNRWLQRGKTRRDSPGWHLRSMRYDLGHVSEVEPTSLAAITPAASSKTYEEVWYCVHDGTRPTEQREPWIVLTDRPGEFDDQYFRRTRERLREVMAGRNADELGFPFP